MLFPWYAWVNRNVQSQAVRPCYAWADSTATVNVLRDKHTLATKLERRQKATHLLYKPARVATDCVH